MYQSSIRFDNFLFSMFNLELITIIIDLLNYDQISYEDIHYFNFVINLRFQTSS